MKKNGTLSSKFVFTILVLCICRLGSFIPIAGLDFVVLNELVHQNQSGILGMFNMLSGGALGRMSLFALALMPYITSSIIVQLGTIIYKPLDNLKKEGEAGRRKITQLSRYVTILLAIIQSYGLVTGLESMQTNIGSAIVISGVLFKLGSIATLVAGTMLLVWLGERISIFGIGNGTSLVIFIGIISGIPSAIINLFDLSRKGALPVSVLLVLCLAIVFLVAVVVFFEKAQRRILIHYPKKQVGNKIYGGESSHMPLKLNTAGVIPPIFASSILLFPSTIVNLSSVGDKGDNFLSTLGYYFSHGKVCYILFYIALIVFFSFFYTALVFNSEDTANNLKKYGAYIPGKRPGKDTAGYFDYVLTRLTVLGSAYLAFICVIPEMIMNSYGTPLSLSGTSFLIVVNVILDTFGQIQTHMFNIKYEGLVKKMKLTGR